MENAKIRIFAALADHLDPSEIQMLLMKDELDVDGDPVLRIQVVIKDDGPSPEPAKIFSATSVVLRVLENLGDNRFPLLTFPSSDEMPGVAA